MVNPKKLTPWRQEMAEFPVAFTSDECEAVGVALLNSTSANLQTVVTGNLVTGEVSNALIANAEETYKVGAPLASLQSQQLQGESVARVTLPHSTYLDFTSYNTTTATTVEEAYGLRHPHLSDKTLNVALILPRANDPSALLTADWATRQATLAQLEGNGTSWSTYGANTADFSAAVAQLKQMGIPVLGDATGSDGYITSPESRTIWVQLTPTHFEDLFGQTLYGADDARTSGDIFSIQYWHGELSLPNTIKATGIWFDSAPIFGTFPAVSDLSGGVVGALQQGPQSVGVDFH